MLTTPYPCRASSSDSASRTSRREEHQDLAARLDTEFGRTLPQDRYARYAQRYRRRFTTQVTEPAATVNRDLAQRPDGVDFIAVFHTTNEPRDAWDNPYAWKKFNWMRGHKAFYIVRSAGPDPQVQ